MDFSVANLCFAISKTQTNFAEVAVLHQDQYAQGIALAGYFNPILSRGLSVREKNYLSSKYDLIKYLQNHPRNTKIMVIASVKDRFANNSALRFVQRAYPLISIKYIPIPSGGHNIGVWKPFVATGFLWIAGANAIATPVVNPQASVSGSPK